MTIRLSLFSVLGVLGILLVTLSALGGLDAWRNWSAATRARQVNMATDLLLDASHEVMARRDAFSLGQSHSHGAADIHGGRAAQPAEPARHGGHAGAQGDGTFDTAMARLHGLEAYRGRQRLMESVHEGRRKLDELQAAMAGESHESHGDVMAEWASTADRLLTDLEALRLSSVRTAQAGATASSYSMMKHFALVVVDYASRERAAIAQLIADDYPIPPGRLAELSGWRGRLELAWQSLEEAEASGFGGERVAVAVGRVRVALFGEFGATREEVYRAGLSGRLYPVDAETWTGAAAGAIAAVLELQEAIVAANLGELDAAADEAFRNMAMLAALLAIGVCALVYSVGIVAGRVVGPINAMTRAMTTLASGNTDVDVPAARRRDEIGEMGRAVHVFRDNAVEKARLEAEQAEAERRLREERRRTMLAMADRFEGDVKELVDAVTESSRELEATARQLSSMADETARQSTAVAGASTQVSANVQTVATATEELSVSVAEIARRIESSAGIATSAVDQANRTSETVRQLEEVTARIGEVVTLINDIAGRTNLLALNATIEAARAGDAGKGFAVVAQEVKSLASQTARATEEVSTQVAAVQERSRGTADAIGGIVSIIAEIGQISGQISAAVEEQDASTNEIARNVQSAAAGTQQVSDSIETVNRAAGETGTAAERVQEASESLLGRADTLRVEVDRFLREVRAA